MRLDALINEFDHMVSPSFSPLSSLSIRYTIGGLIVGPIVYDWRPEWDKARRIQQFFKAGVATR